MLYFLTKLAITALVVAIVSEIAKRSSLLAGLIASLPLTSVLAIIWLYLDTAEMGRVAALSRDILLMLLPSILFFLVLIAGHRLALGFWPSLLAAIAFTAGGYVLYLNILARFGITL